MFLQVFTRVGLSAVSRALASALFIGALSASTRAAQEEPTPAWAFTTGGRIVSSPSAAKGVVYVGSDDHHVYALDAGDGALRWKRELAAPLRSQPLVEKNSVFVVSGNSATCLAHDDGSVRWTFSPQDDRGAEPIDRWDYHQSSSVLNGALLYYGGGNGVLHALDAESGAPKFTFSTDDNAPIRSRPAVKDGTAYIGDWNGVVYALDAATGALRWKRPTCDGPKPYPTYGAVVSQMLAADGRLYFGARNAEVQCLDAESGATVWSFTAANGSWVAGSPVLDGDVIYITGSDDHRVHALGARDGVEQWSCEVSANMFIAPLIVGDRMIVGDLNCYADDAGTGHLHVIDRSSGKLLRSIHVGGNIGASSPLVAAGRVVFGSEDGRVVAYDLANLLD